MHTRLLAQCAGSARATVGCCVSWGGPESHCLPPGCSSSCSPLPSYPKPHQIMKRSAQSPPMTSQHPAQLDLPAPRLPPNTHAPRPALPASSLTPSPSQADFSWFPPLAFCSSCGPAPRSHASPFLTPSSPVPSAGRLSGPASEVTPPLAKTVSFSSNPALSH